MVEKRWLDNLARDATRFNIVFLHLGAAFGPYREQLAALDCSHVDAVAFARSESAEVSTSRVSGAGDQLDAAKLLVIHGVEAFRMRKSPSLGALRARVHREVDQDTRIVLVSEIAKDCYPVIAGSDLLSDARQHFISIEVPESESLSCLPGRAAAVDDSALMRQCLDEVGHGTLEMLGGTLWEHMMSPNDSLNALDAPALSSLRGAGLVAIHDGRLQWVTNSSWKAFRFAVAEVSSCRVQPDGGLHQVFVDLWIIERRIRNGLRSGLADKLGSGWRAGCIPEGMRKEVLERAQRDAHPRAERMADLRDPLEWLTTSELLDLRLTHQLGDLGMEPYLWTKLREVVLPVRNRVAHMRLVDQQDALNIATWRAVIEKKFS